MGWYCVFYAGMMVWGRLIEVSSPIFIIFVNKIEVIFHLFYRSLLFILCLGSKTDAKPTLYALMEVGC